jgi:hypothetical protein
MHIFPFIVCSYFKKKKIEDFIIPNNFYLISSEARCYIPENDKKALLSSTSIKRKLKDWKINLARLNAGKKEYCRTIKKIVFRFFPLGTS